MSESAKAVFLSYASQDAEEVMRICTALRAAGVEVWFDQNELVGGDAWDAKIRKQISECGLFVPIISAATQARDEGYFRLEWKLAVDRSHLMVHDKAFLLPIVIDATTDAAARVPPEFRAVQWTHLRQGYGGPARPSDGEALEKFCSRVKQLLGGSVVGGALRPDSSSRADESGPKAPSTADRRTSRRPWFVPVALGAAALIALALWQPWRTKEAVAPTSPTAASASAPAKPLTEAQQLVEKARKIYDEGDEFNRETYTLAEELLKKAEALDVTEASAWALHAELSFRLYNIGLDRSMARTDARLVQAGRAMKLAPEARGSQLAAALMMTSRAQDSAEGYRQIKRLADEDPSDWRILRHLIGEDKGFDAMQIARTALALAPDEPKLKADLLWNVFRFRNQFDESDQFVREAMKGRTNARLLLFNVWLGLIWRSDSRATVAEVEQWPGWLMAEDKGVALASLAYLWSGYPGKVLELAKSFPRDQINDFVQFNGPRAVLTAWAHEQMGNNEAALADWRIALKVTDRELATEPDKMETLYWKAWALASTGDVTTAENILRQLTQKSATTSPIAFYMFGGLAGLQVKLGHPDEAIASLAGFRTGRTTAVRVFPKAYLRLNPVLTPLRTNPRFQALIDAAPGPEAKPAAAAASVSLDEKAVAVLPFANLSGDKEQEYFSDGLTEEILNALARERDLRVPGRTSSFSFKGKNASATEIASALNVSRLVEGSVQRSGTKVRIRVSLTRVADNASEELGTFTEELADIFALQDKVARAVVEKLTHRQLASSAIAPTKNADAYDLYLRGRALQTRNTAGGIEAMLVYQRAVELDPSFALAWARIAEAHLAVFRSYDRSPERAAAVHHALTKAFEIQPDLPEALITRALEAEVNTDYATAKSSLQRIETLAAPTAELRYTQALLARDTGDWTAYPRLIREAVALDPQNGNYQNNLAVGLNQRGEFREADALFARAMALQGLVAVPPFFNRAQGRLSWRGPEAALRLAERSPPEQASREAVRVKLLVELGRIDEAKHLAAKLVHPAELQVASFMFDQIYVDAQRLAGDPQNARRIQEEWRAAAQREFARGNHGRFVLEAYISAEIDLGNREIAMATLNSLQKEFEQKTASVRYALFGHFAPKLLARLGQRDESIAMVRENLLAGFQPGYDLRYDPDYALLRDDPRFQNLMQQAEAWAKAQPDPVDP